MEGEVRISIPVADVFALAQIFVDSHDLKFAMFQMFFRSFENNRSKLDSTERETNKLFLDHFRSHLKDLIKYRDFLRNSIDDVCSGHVTVAVLHKKAVGEIYSMDAEIASKTVQASVQKLWDLEKETLSRLFDKRIEDSTALLQAEEAKFNQQLR